MYTRNWDNIQAMVMAGIYTNGETGFDDGSLYLKNTAGTLSADGDAIGTSTGSAVHYKTIGHASGVAVLQTAAATFSAVGSAFILLPGSGTGAESYEDYCLTALSSQAHTSYTYGSPSYNATTDKWSCTVQRTMINNSGAEITVAEIGMIINLGDASYNFLVCRKKLDTPFAVPAGSSYQISLTFEYQAQSH